MFRAAMGPSSGETTVFLRQLVLVILCGWQSGIPAGIPDSCFSWWWAHSRTCFRRLWAHHQEKQLWFRDNWYLLFCEDDCLVCLQAHQTVIHTE